MAAVLGRMANPSNTRRNQLIELNNNTCVIQVNCFVIIVVLMSYSFARQIHYVVCLVKLLGLPTAIADKGSSGPTAFS